ncbi:hypothetical protein [Bradyrhizobium iriomotense]|uniref:DUF982 domain-containing protein n=1 Tax=Bradyrhizobium iriomotense TaxID=441950 RepID=A0ABQ6BDS1_9BRAD|nr:hypothetical protein [Bradyrhizobium iriomotense]GLR91938.1 hypothetical protein GCM10007857_86560 [Bradyrhizobium iriomotense]
MPQGPRCDLTCEDEAMGTFAQCFARAAPNQSWFATAVKKAPSPDLLPPLRQRALH